MSQLELLDIARAHDPGGKVRTKLPPGMCGDAVLLGALQAWRPRLRRWLGDVFPARYVLWIGMNPSTGDASVNDTTITREWGFTQRLGYAGYVKCNVADYRATKPSDLLAPGLAIESASNRATILAEAAGAEVVICCWGSVNKVLAPIAATLLTDLRRAGIQLYCLGKNADGSPRHPLYLAKSTPLEMF